MFPFVAAVLFLAASPPSPAQEAPSGCRHCDHRGVLDCRRHPKDLVEYEREVRFCSVAAACPDCGGSLLVDCPRCEGGPESALLKRRRAEIAAWRARRLPVEERLGRSLLRGETEDFALIVDVPSLRLGKHAIDGHHFLHRVLHDLRGTATRFHEHFQATRADQCGIERLWFWGRQRDHATAMLEFLSSGAGGDFKMLGKQPLFSVWTGDPVFGNDGERLRRLAVHNGAHMLMSNLYRELWIGDLRGGWFDAGAAHWYEAAVFGRSLNSCIDEAVRTPNYHDGHWRSALYELFRKKGQGPVLPELCNQLSGTLSDRQHALAWSLYDWLVEVHPDTLPAFLHGFQARKHSRELFRDLLHMDMHQTESAWRAWLATAYRPRPGSRRR